MQKNQNNTLFDNIEEQNDDKKLLEETNKKMCNIIIEAAKRSKIKLPRIAEAMGKRPCYFAQFFRTKGSVSQKMVAELLKIDRLNFYEAEKNFLLNNAPDATFKRPFNKKKKTVSEDGKDSEDGKASENGKASDVTKGSFLKKLIENNIPLQEAIDLMKEIFNENSAVS